MNPKDPRIESVDGDTYILSEPFESWLGMWIGDWVSEIDFTIPAGERTDIASVPWGFRWIYDRASLGFLGPINHDILCKEEGRLINRAGKRIQLSWFKVHLCFLLLMLMDGIPERRAFLAFVAVLIGGPRWKLDHGWLTQTDKPD